MDGRGIKDSRSKGRVMNDSMNRLWATITHPSRRRQRSTAASVFILGGCVLWSLWPVIAGMVDRWSRDPRYSHGYLVPLFAVALLWMRRSRLHGESRQPSTWGLAVVGLASALQLAGGYYGVESLEGCALLIYFAGLTLLFGDGRYSPGPGRRSRFSFS